MNLLSLFDPLIKNIKQEIEKNNRNTVSQFSKDIKLEIDRILHAKIVKFLQEEFEYDILSEEASNQRNFIEYTDYYWIVDPLDGSLNLHRSIPLSCISIALWKRQVPVVGVVYDFNHNDLFIGVTEQVEGICDKKGAWLNGKPIKTSPVKESNSGIVSTGFPSWRSYDEDSLKRFVQKIQEWKKIRLIGSAALSLAWVACGRVDAYIEEDIRIWDVAAGLALVKAAGGDIYFKVNERPNFVTAIATNGKIKTEELV